MLRHDISLFKDPARVELSLSAGASTVEKLQRSLHYGVHVRFLKCKFPQDPKTSMPSVIFKLTTDTVRTVSVNKKLYTEN